MPVVRSPLHLRPGRAIRGSSRGVAARAGGSRAPACGAPLPTRPGPLGVCNYRPGPGSWAPPWGLLRRAGSVTEVLVEGSHAIPVPAVVRRCAHVRRARAGACRVRGVGVGGDKVSAAAPARRWVQAQSPGRPSIFSSRCRPPLGCRRWSLVGGCRSCRRVLVTVRRVVGAVGVWIFPVCRSSRCVDLPGASRSRCRQGRTCNAAFARTPARATLRGCGSSHERRCRGLPVPPDRHQCPGLISSPSSLRAPSSAARVPSDTTPLQGFVSG